MFIMENKTEVLMEFLNFKNNSTKQVFDKFKTIPNHVFRYKTELEQFIFIEGTRDDKVVLIAHADTIWEGTTNLKKELKVKKGIIRNKKSGLGADDRAGCAILWLLRNSGHSLLIVSGEEFGFQGSYFLKEENPDIYEIINKHQFMIQFDRRNATDFKCYNVGSDDFREYIIKKTGYIEPNRFSETDICCLCDKICGVNLSVGYYNEHEEGEYLIISEWLNTLGIVEKWLSEEKVNKFLKPEIIEKEIDNYYNLIDWDYYNSFLR